MDIKHLATAVLLSIVVVGVAPGEAAQRGRGPAVGRAVPRGGGVYGPRVIAPYGTRIISPRIVRPAVIGVLPYRPYAYRPRFSVGIYAGYPYAYGYPYYGYYGSPYGYPAYGYPAYGYSGYGYSTPPGYIAAVPGRPYGGVRITDAPPDAAVYVDGYYVGIADDFDGAFQHMNLEAGPHRIEIRPQGEQPIAFDVNVQPGQTITYRYPW